MSQSFREWMKAASDKLAENLRLSILGQPTVTKTAGTSLLHEGEAVVPESVMLTPSVADPVGGMLAVVPQRVNPPVTSNLTPYRGGPSVADPAWDDDLDHITQTCTHPGIAITRFTQDGQSSYHCMRCAKTWPSLPDAVADAEQTMPINMNVVGEGGSTPLNVIPAVVSTLATEMAERMAQTVSALVEATAVPNSPATVGDYQDFVSMTDFAGTTMAAGPAAEYYSNSFRQNLRNNTPFRSPLVVREGGQTQNINASEVDPALRNAGSQLRQAQLEAQDAMARRHKAMEDAARAAAAAFDAGVADKAEPVKLEAERRLKVVS
jgi:hypothetical protein